LQTIICRRRTRLVCFTDDGAGINPNVQIEPIPHIDLPKDLALTPWRKLTMWKSPLADLEGDILFLDLDLVITGNLDDLFVLSKSISPKKSMIWSFGPSSGARALSIRLCLNGQ